MRRAPALIPLSHQHHNALALCVRIERSLSAQPRGRWPAGDAEQWQAEIERLFANEIQYHFQAEEQVLFPAAKNVPELAPLVEELSREHLRLRELSARAGSRELDPAELLRFSGLLAAHVRKEERQLFEALQNALAPEALKSLGNELDAWFVASGMPGAACDI